MELSGRWVGPVVIAIILTALTVGGVAAESPSRIEGQIVNGTAAGAVPDGLPVTLDGFRLNERLATRTVTAGPDGAFRFDDVASGTDFAYLISVDYAGVTYSSDALRIADGATVQTGVTIYDTTADDPGISMATVTRLLRRQSADAVSVLQIADIRVPGDRTYTPQAQAGAPPPLRFGVPEGAFDLQTISGVTPDQIVVGGPGFAVFAPLRPGVHSLVFGYQLAIPAGSVAFDWRVPLRSDTVRLLSEAGALDTKVEGLPLAGQDTFGDLTVLRWEARDVPAGTTLAVRVVDATLPGLVRTIRTTTADRWALIAGGAGVALAAGLAVWRRGWRRRGNLDPEVRARQLAEEIGAIDAQPNADLDRARRQQLRGALVDLVTRHPELAERLRDERRADRPAAG